MGTPNTYLAVFLGSKSSPKMAAWNAMSDAERKMKEQQGIAAWMTWAQKHQEEIVTTGGPLGKTKKISSSGIEDVTNAMGAFTVVRAELQEAAAKLFLDHPHFTIFPGGKHRSDARSLPDPRSVIARSVIDNRWRRACLWSALPVSRCRSTVMARALNQDIDNPLGIGGLALHGWSHASRTFQKMFGKEGGTAGTDDDFVARATEDVGAGSLAAICSAPCADRGRTAAGRAGGVRTRPITRPSSC